MRRLQLRSLLSSVLGGALLLAGLAVPSELWLDSLRSTPPELRVDLLTGAAIFRVGLVCLGSLALLGARWDWWSAPSGTAPRATRSRGEGLALAAILGLALAVRLYRLDSGLWIDEISMLVDYIRRPLGEILTTFHSENQHFSYSILAHESVALFGESAWSIRLPAALFGVGSLWALFLVGREVADRREALLTTALLGAAYHHVWFSQNARGYTGVLCFALLSTWFFLRGMRDRDARHWLGFAAATTLGMYTHLTMVFVVAGQLALYLWDLWRHRSAPQAGRWTPLPTGFLLAGIATVTLYGFGIPQFIHEALQEASVVATWRDPLWTIAETLRALGLVGPRAVVALAGLAVVAVGAARYRNRPEIVVLLVLPAALAAGTALGMGHHLWPRTFFIVVGFGALIAVRGLLACVEAGARLLRFSAPAQRQLATASVCLLIAGSAATLGMAYRPKQDFAGARDFVNAERWPGDAVLAVGVADFPYEVLYAPEWGSAADSAELLRIRAASSRTWVVYTFPLHMQAQHPDILEVLHSEFEFVRRFEGSLGGGAIFVYRADGPGSRSEHVSSSRALGVGNARAASG